MPHQFRNKVHATSLKEKSIKIHCKWVAHYLTHLRGGGGHDIWKQCTKHRVIVLFLINAFHSFEIELDRVFPTRSVFHRLPRTIPGLRVLHLTRCLLEHIIKMQFAKCTCVRHVPPPWSARVSSHPGMADKPSTRISSMHFVCVHACGPIFFSFLGGVFASLFCRLNSVPERVGRRVCFGDAACVCVCFLSLTLKRSKCTLSRAGHPGGLLRIIHPSELNCRRKQGQKSRAPSRGLTNCP